MTNVFKLMFIFIYCTHGGIIYSSYSNIFFYTWIQIAHIHICTYTHTYIYIHPYMHASFILHSFVRLFVHSFELTHNFIDQLADGPQKLTMPVGARKDRDASSACGPQPLVGWLSRLKILIASGSLKIGLHRFMDVDETGALNCFGLVTWHQTTFVWMFICIRGKHLKHFGTGLLGQDEQVRVWIRDSQGKIPMLMSKDQTYFPDSQVRRL